MASNTVTMLTFIAFVFSLLATSHAQSSGVTAAPISPTPSPSSYAYSSNTYSTATIASNTTSAGSTATPTLSGAPDVHLRVPTLSVGRIELDVEDLSAEINLAAKVASLVTLNAGVSVSVSKVNITISEVDAELELIVRLGNLVSIVQRVFDSLDLNPLLISALNDVTQVVEAAVGAVDGLLGSITNGNSTLNFLVDNLGNIVQEVTDTAGTVTSDIIGNYLTNMTYTGVSTLLDQGQYTQKTYEYSPLNALVDIVFNTAGQIVQATVQSATGSSTSAAATATAAAKRRK